MKRKISFLLVAVLLLATLIPALPVLATEEGTVVNTFNPKDSNPTISTAEDFIAFYKACFIDPQGADGVDNSWRYKGRTVTLLRDIDLNNVNLAESGGTTTQEQWSWFSGTFDGQGHTVKGVTVNGSVRQGMAGLFPATADATIKNLNVDGFYVCNTEETRGWKDHGDYGTGGLVGYAAFNLTIENCSMKNGIVTSKKKDMGALGALVGVYSGYDGRYSNYSIKITDTTVSNVTVENQCAQRGGVIGSAMIIAACPSTFDFSGFAFYSVDSADAESALKPIGVLGLKGDVATNAFFRNSANGYGAQNFKKVTLSLEKALVGFGDGKNNYRDFTEEGNEAVLGLGCYGADANPMVKIKGVQPATDGSDNLRFVGMIKKGDLALITDLGFVLTVGDKIAGTDKIQCTKVYESILAAGEKVDAPEGYYFFTFVVTGVTSGTKLTFNASATVDGKVCTTTAGSYTYTRAAS